MSYIKFDKNQLTNLKYSLSKEVIRSNRTGAYASTTIIYCNTRKYHGLLICPIKEFNGHRHVLLSNVHETIIQQNKEFNIGIFKYPNLFNPLGHKYLMDYTNISIPKLTYRVGGVVLDKEVLLSEDEEQILIRYTLVEAHSPTKIQLKPFLAFRSIHTLSKANMYINQKVHSVENGIKTKLYDGYPFLHMQLSKQNEYFPAPDWYYNIEYQEEQKRGYDYLEDLFVPGFFEVPIEKGESIVFAAGLKDAQTKTLCKNFEKEVRKRIPRSDYENSLQNAAVQFIQKKGNKTYITAGFPWFGSWGRDTLISCPGLTLSNNNIELCESVLDTITEDNEGALFKNVGTKKDADVNSVDAPLWYFWAIQQYIKYSGNQETAWKKYSKKMKSILEGYKNGLQYNIKMQDNFLIWAGQEGKALTWMDAVVNGVPVTPRIGYNVEINALWYNAIMFSLELARKFKDTKFVKEWEPIANQIPENFTKMFYNAEKKQLADFVDNSGQKLAVRPNQVFATSLPYTPINDDIKNEVLDIVKTHLLTPRGLRSLSPFNKSYIGVYEGNQEQRDMAYHQGTVWPWLLGHFIEGSLKLYGRTFINEAKRIYFGFEEELTNHGVGTVSEIYDGDPPHIARGAISQAWSVAELLRIKMLIQEFEKK